MCGGGAGLGLRLSRTLDDGLYLFIHSFPTLFHKVFKVVSLVNYTYVIKIITVDYTGIKFLNSYLYGTL